jgi:hypothetical protein
MAALKIEILSGNDAFSDGNAPAEMARILRDLAERIEDYGSLDLQWNLRDINGNTVGICCGGEAAAIKGGDDD